MLSIVLFVVYFCLFSVISDRFSSNESQVQIAATPTSPTPETRIETSVEIQAEDPWVEIEPLKPSITEITSESHPETWAILQPLDESIEAPDSSDEVPKIEPELNESELDKTLSLEELKLVSRDELRKVAKKLSGDRKIANYGRLKAPELRERLYMSRVTRTELMLTA